MIGREGTGDGGTMTGQGVGVEAGPASTRWWQGQEQLSTRNIRYPQGMCRRWTVDGGKV